MSDRLDFDADKKSVLEALSPGMRGELSVRVLPLKTSNPEMKINPELQDPLMYAQVDNLKGDDFKKLATQLGQEALKDLKDRGVDIATTREGKALDFDGGGVSALEMGAFIVAAAVDKPTGRFATNPSFNNAINPRDMQELQSGEGLQQVLDDAARILRQNGVTNASAAKVIDPNADVPLDMDARGPATSVGPRPRSSGPTPPR